jgi:DNA topoisomerase-3
VAARETETESSKDQLLPPLKNGELGTVLAVRVLEKKTRPPPRYTEGLLIEDMKNAGKYVDDPALRAVLKEVSGLGTSATRDSIIEVLKHHQYLTVSGKHLIPTDKGESLIRWLETHCAELADIALTARWEAELDAIATRGGGGAFELAIANRVREIVTTLRPAAPIPRSAASTENKKMTEPQTGASARRPSKPTPKMLEYAQKIATKLGQKLTPEIVDDFDQCRAYIDANKEAASRPTEKQLNFAKQIAERKGAQIPAEALADGRLLSKWIDDNK